MRSARQTLSSPLIRRSRGTLWLRLVFIFGILFSIQAFGYQLQFDKATGISTGSRIVQFISLSCTVFALATIVMFRDAYNMVVRCWPILALGGIGLLSVLWSINHSATVRNAYNFLSIILFTLALAGRLSAPECFRQALRLLTLGCALSILWVIVLPKDAVHQADDVFQMQHAGLWRGIFTHKQGLGAFAGIATGLYLFYGPVAFSSLIFRIGALACCAIALWGTQSTTGFITAIVLAVMLYTTWWISYLPQRYRLMALVALISVFFLLGAAFRLGFLDFVPALFGKSSSLTGRLNDFPYMRTLLWNSGRGLLGGGLRADLIHVLIPDIGNLDSGYMNLLFEFGYLGATVLLALYGWIAWAGLRLIERLPPQRSGIQLFPLSFMCALFLMNITEDFFMKREITTVLVSIAMSLIVSLRLQPMAAIPRKDMYARMPREKSALG